MSSKNKKNQTLDLSALLKGLNEAGIEFILVGGMAAVAQGAPVTTFDLDIVHRQTDENIERLIKFLRSIGAYQRRPDDKVIRPNERICKGKDMYSWPHVLDHWMFSQPLKKAVVLRNF